MFGCANGLQAGVAERASRWLVASTVLVFSLAGFAASQPKVLALFPDKAMISVDGSRQLISVGEPVRGGVRLISANSKEAVIEFNGRVDTYRLASDIGGSYSKPRLAEVRILRDNRGGFSTDGSINGHAVRLLVDTGASMVAMSSMEAERLGIDYQQQGIPVGVSTAAGLSRGHAVKLQQVKVGPIELPNVGAVVIEGPGPRQVLLGMTFLNRVVMENQGNILKLKAKY